MTEKSAEDFQTVTGMTPYAFVSKIKAMTLDELSAWFATLNAQGNYIGEILDRGQLLYAGAHR